jgi:hypothetical protein
MIGKLMSYIGSCVERVRKGPTKALAQIKAELRLVEEGANGES